MEVDSKSDNEDQDSVTGGGPEEASKKRKVSASPISGEKKAQANKRVKGIDDQAEESGDDEEENSEDGSGGEEEEDESNYVYNDFLVRDDENSDASDDDAGSQEGDRVKPTKKRDLKRLGKRKGVVQLDEEDLQLVREYEANNAARSNKASAGTKARAAFDYDDGEIAPIEGRMRSNTHDSDDYDQAENGGEEGAEGGGATDRNRAGRRPQSSFYNDDDEGSDMGGFIVDEDSDEEGAEGGDGKPRRRSGSGVDQDGGRGGGRAEHQIPHRRTGGRRDGPTYDQFQDAMDIFGAGFDDFDDEDLGGEDGVNSDEGDSDAEGALEGRVTTDKLRKMDLTKDGDYLESIGEQIELTKRDKRRIQKLRNRYERSHLVATFCTERDDVLRRVDRPERLQEVLVGRDTPEEAERVLEARWMASKLATKMVTDNHLTSSRETVRFTANPLAANRSALYFLQSNEEKEQRLREELEEPILHVLRFLQVCYDVLRGYSTYI